MIRLVCALVCIGTALAGCSEAREEPRAAGEAAAPSAQTSTDTLRIGFVFKRGAPRDPEVMQTAAGVRLGVEEAQHAAAMFGQAVEWFYDDDPERLVTDRRVQALVGGFGEEQCRKVAEVAQRRSVLYLNVACTSDALRGDACYRFAFHVAPSEAMLADAARAAGVEGGRAAAWHDSLERFGAGQLRDRFRARWRDSLEVVGSQGWVGWLAVKVLWESTLRARTAEASALVSYLERPSTQFDGHKGRPLSFRSWDHQLRQPLYVAAPSGDVVEVPKAAPGSEESSRELLDRLGTTEAETRCRFASSR